MNIDGAAVLITGGAGCIGRTLVKGFQDAGASVGVLEKEDVACQDLKAEFGENLRTWRCNIADHEIVEAVFASMFEEGFFPDILINNAGLIHNEPLISLSAGDITAHAIDTWNETLSTNLAGVFHVTRQVARNMVGRRNKGVVISVSSISANGNIGQSAYSAAKAGVNALTKTWAKELGALGVRFAAIAPGFLDTASTHAALSPENLQALRKRVPLRKLGQPEDVLSAAFAVVQNEYLTGTVIEVDGGLVI